MGVRIVIPVLLGLCALVLAPTASAATLSLNKPCFRAGTLAPVVGTGFTPNRQVEVRRDGTPNGLPTTGPFGAFGGFIDTGEVSAGERRYTFEAIDVTNGAIRAATQLRVSALDVSVLPDGGSPSRLRRVRARGFVGGRTLYAHVRGGRGYKLRLRIGRLRGACATVSARRRLLKRRTPVGSYRVQLDAHRRYSRCRRVTPTRSCVVLRVRVFRTFRFSSASAFGTGETWKQIVGPSASGGSPGFSKLP